ncbi:SDR family oxidoreductase [Mycobacterium sp. PS03-16]|uniref:SDR family NAD(P)-dependent oxidoreductase n=1 Tax=Mycobacterium sp. PS03-16 TaxID=2559611 RepID=UPI001073BB9E|nr:SDR family oxidoreductase [Mycobacterium sp. PS03-16]TFV59372.1 SDR family oxidoreductase [Mycobacterium sp. PS03-16]
MNLSGRTALVTGASGGIGEEFAVRLAAAGVNLILVARRTERLEELRGQLLARHPGREVDVLTADLAVPGAAAEVAAQIRTLGRKADILVNNAGVGSHGRFAEQDPAANAAQIQLNCVALVELTGHLLPAMVAARRGIVINVGSTAGFQPVPSMAVYGATKAFVLSFSEALWQETRGQGVKVLTLCPGATETEFFDRTGKSFATRGRQTSAEVVDTALKALDRPFPTVVSGLQNRILALGYRIAPRPVLAMVSEQMMRATGRV